MSTIKAIKNPKTTELTIILSELTVFLVLATDHMI